MTIHSNLFIFKIHALVLVKMLFLNKLNIKQQFIMKKLKKISREKFEKKVNGGSLWLQEAPDNPEIDSQCYYWACDGGQWVQFLCEG